MKLRGIFQTLHAEFVQLPGLQESVNFMVKNSGYNIEHIEALKKASVDDYEAMFMKVHDEVKLSSQIKWTLRWRDGDHAEIAIKAREALERIAATSLLNSIRVKRYVG